MRSPSRTNLDIML